MSTIDSKGRIGTALFGKTQRRLLALFFVRPDNSFYLRQIVRTCALGQGAVQRELARWVEAGLLVRTRRGNQVYYQANPVAPVFEELKALAIKTVGVADVLRQLLVALAERIEVAFIHGSLVHGTEKADSDVDLVVIGEVSFGEIVDALGPAQEMIGREVNPSVYASLEFRKKLQSRHHFVTTLWDAKKIYLVGDDRELGRLAT